MVPTDLARRCDHERSALLPLVALRAALTRTVAQCLPRVGERARIERRADAALELGGAIHRERWIGVDRSDPAGLLAKPGDEARRAIADHVELGAGGAHRFDIAEQSCDVLA